VRRLRGCALSPIALFVFTPPLCLLALALTLAHVALAPNNRAGGRARTTRGGCSQKGAGGRGDDGRRRYAADAASVRLSLPIGRLDGGSRRREARQEAVGLELEERFGIA